MYYTHYFANHESLARTRTWLGRLGFAAENIETHTNGIPRLTVAVDPARWSGVKMLINAVERSDPDGWPGFWDVANQTHVYPESLMSETAVEPLRGRSTAIGWHPTERPSATAQDHDASDSVTSLTRRWS